MGERKNGFINELAKKEREEGLTNAEPVEQ